MFYYAIAILIAVVGLYFSRKASPEIRYGGDITSPRTRWVIFSFVPLIAVTVPAFVVTGGAIGRDNNVKNSMYVLEELQDQRDALADIFEEVLDNEEFVQLMEASIPEDVVFLKNNPQVSDFLLGKADRIVAVNNRLYTERNAILAEARELCNSSENPFVVKVPFLYPDCRLGSVLEITTDYEE